MNTKLFTAGLVAASLASAAASAILAYNVGHAAGERACQTTITKLEDALMDKEDKAEALKFSLLAHSILFDTFVPANRKAELVEEQTNYLKARDYRMKQRAEEFAKEGRAWRLKLALLP